MSYRPPLGSSHSEPKATRDVFVSPLYPYRLMEMPAGLTDRKLVVSAARLKAWNLTHWEYTQRVNRLIDEAERLLDEAGEPVTEERLVAVVLKTWEEQKRVRRRVTRDDLA
jgi:hypothetical protein